MSTKVGSIHYDLDLNDKNFKSKMSSASKDVKGFGSKVGDILDKAKMGSFALLGGVIAAGAFATKMTLTAARTETLGVSLGVMAKQTGVSTKALKEQEEVLKKQGITTQQARRTLAAFMQSQLDVTKSSKLARVAQDLAVVAGENSSETTGRLTNAIATMNPLLLRQVGIVKNSEEIFADYGKTIGKSGDALTETEKKQAVLNLILKEGEKVAGTYEAAMKTAGKKLGSLPRLFEEAANTIGTVFLPILGTAIDVLSENLKSITPESIERLKDFIVDNAPIIAGAITFGLIPAFVALAGSIWAMMAPLIPFLVIGVLMGLLAKKLIDRYGGLDEVMKKLQPTIDILTVAFNIIWDAIKDLWKTIKEQLMPALKDFWKMAGPTIIPVLKFLATVIGGSIVLSILVAIKWLKFIITIFSKVVRAIGWVIEKVRQVAGWFGGINESIARALTGVGESIMKPFRKAFDWLQEKTDQVKGFLNKLNPFSKSSPSLVQWIQRGTDQMIKDYGAFFNKIEDMSVSARPVITQAVQGASASPAGGNTSVSVRVDMSGIMALSESEIREKGEIIIEAVNQGLRAKGVPEIGVA